MLEFNQTDNGERETLFVEVVLPLAIAKTYTYRVPFEMANDVVVGKRVVVQFGRSRMYTAIIYSISTVAPSLYEAKYILQVLDDEPVVNAFQLKLWTWMADYYLCQLGEVMQAALPAALKLASETRVVLNPDANFDRTLLSDKEFLILDALEIHQELPVSEISKLLGQKTVFPLLRSLFEKNIVVISEEIKEKFKPRTRSFIRLNPIYTDADNRRALFEVLERAPKQLELLLAYYKLEREKTEISRETLMEAAGGSAAALKGLLEKEIFIKEEKIVSRIATGELEAQGHFELSEEQNSALESVRSGFKSGKTMLLFGETSSGKTQLYIRLIEDMLAQGRQILYLLPEIALTTQAIERMRTYFGDAVGIYHSRFSDSERAEVWQRVAKGGYKLVLGARSSVFLPFSDLGLIVIDEEHEPSYKQYDPAPRYHARDTAIYLAHLHGAHVVLGSATPSLESFYNARIDKYGLVKLKGRFGGVERPAITIANLSEETKKKTMQSHFTSVLMGGISQALENKEQVILFQNRRGYTPLLLCTTCGYTPKCINCDVSLTYHKSSSKLHCHYCGYRQETLQICPACGSAHIEQKGFGTEKIEDELQILFPNARIARMDLDSTRTRNGFQILLNDFEDGRIDILVGTQMVAKGLDFGNVSTIGIIGADSMLNYPDFRAFERGFQLLSQVSGRAGRRSKQGKVIIQAYNVDHRILRQVIANDYEKMFETEILERRNYGYPPLYRLIELSVKHKDPNQTAHSANTLAAVLRQHFAERVLGPETPAVARVRNYYIRTILLKIEKEQVSVHKMKALLRDLLTAFYADPAHKGVQLQTDVDPY